MGRNNRQVTGRSKQDLPVTTDELMAYSALYQSLIHDAHTKVGVSGGLLDVATAKSRCEQEGLSFLTKALPTLGKALDQCLLSGELVVPQGFGLAQGCAYPLFLSELWAKILDPLGRLIVDPPATVVLALRELLYLFYKLKVPYDPDTTRSALDSFESTDRGLALSQESLGMGQNAPQSQLTRSVLSGATLVLQSLLRDFTVDDDFRPKHGPGVVAQREKYESKFLWTNIPTRLSSAFGPEYFYPSGWMHLMEQTSSVERPARIILVPKDSRGPRIISAEPVENQWIQQGIMRSLVRYIEDGASTGIIARGYVNFTDQTINGRLALLASKSGEYATLDLKEASDRISLALFRAVWPDNLIPLFECCRSSETILPDGRTIPLRKYAPMGSGLCFPVLALITWALLRGQGITSYVYGDDVIVPGSDALRAIAILESVDLMVNRSKCCLTGKFRESCGIDAFNGTDVTPLRITKRWSSQQSAESFESWVSYSNSFYNRGYRRTAMMMRRVLIRLYGYIPTSNSRYPSSPSFVFEDLECIATQKRRWNANLQRFEYQVPVSVPNKHRSSHEFANYCRALSRPSKADVGDDVSFGTGEQVLHHKWEVVELPFAAVYTQRRVKKLIRRWV